MQRGAGQRAEVRFGVNKHCGLSITDRSCREKLFQPSHIRMYPCNTIYIKLEFWGQNHFRPIKPEWNNKKIKLNSQAGDSEMSACLNSNKKCTRHIPLAWKPHQSSNWKQGHRTETLKFLSSYRSSTMNALSVEQSKFKINIRFLNPTLCQFCWLMLH